MKYLIIAIATIAYLAVAIYLFKKIEYKAEEKENKAKDFDIVFAVYESASTTMGAFFGLAFAKALLLY